MKTMTILQKFPALVCAGLLLLAGCSKGPGPGPGGPGGGPNPQGPTAAFTNLVINGFCKVNLVPGTANTIDSTSGILLKNVVNNTLFISGAGEAWISVKDLDTLIADGSTYTLASSTLNLDHILIIGNGLSKMNLNLSASDSIVAVSNGVGPYDYAGNTPKLHLYANGAARFRGYNLLTQDCIVGLAGIGTSEVYASNSLKVYIAGAGTVYYKGNPAVVDTLFIAGIGKVIKK